MSAALLDAGFSAVASQGGRGHISGDGIGIVTLDNVPGRVMIDLLRRHDNAWLRRQFSNDDGTYRFTGLEASTLYDVIGRDLSDTWEDVIVGRIAPFIPLRVTGDAPDCIIGAAYSYTYVVAGGELPYMATVQGDLPDGLTISVAEDLITIAGTATVSAVGQSFEVVVEDARGATYSLPDHIGVWPVGSRANWRIKFASNNGYAYANLVELEFGGATATGGMPLASSEYNTTRSKAKAFDGVKTGDIGWSSVAGDVSGAWIGYAFAAPIAVNSVTIVAGTNSADLTGMPRDFAVESSINGTDWVTEWSVSGQTGWTANQSRVFNRP